MKTIDISDIKEQIGNCENATFDDANISNVLEGEFLMGYADGKKLYAIDMKEKLDFDFDASNESSTKSIQLRNAVTTKIKDLRSEVGELDKNEDTDPEYHKKRGILNGQIDSYNEFISMLDNKSSMMASLRQEDMTA